MKTSLFAFTAGLLLIFAVGCCGMHGSLACDDPCAGELAGKGCCLKKLFGHGHKSKHGCHCGCHSAHCPTTGCQVAPGCGAPVSYGDCGAPMISGGTCGCGTPETALRPAPAYETQLQNLLPPPTNDAPPSPVPMPGTDPNIVPAVPGADFPAPPAALHMKPDMKKSPQLVSYEEFQRLPGQVVSTATSVPAQPPVTALATAIPTPAPAAPRKSAPSTMGLPVIQPATWMPARSN